MTKPKYTDLGEDCVSCGKIDCREFDGKRSMLTGHKDDNGNFKTMKFHMCGPCGSFWTDYARTHLFPRVAGEAVVEIDGTGLTETKPMDMMRMCPHKEILAFRRARLRGNPYPMNVQTALMLTERYNAD